MNKLSLQAFSTGVIFATAIMAGFYYGTNLDEQVTFTTSDAKKMLQAQGYNISKPNIHIESDQARTNRKTQNTEETKRKETISYILKVKSKMTTSEIAELLEKEKIINNATKFQAYMNKEELSRQVQIGEYIVSSDMSYKELGKLITQ